MFADARQTRIAATTDLIRKWASDPLVVELVLKAANANLRHASGRINTLVLLENVDVQVIEEYGSEIDSMLARFERQGGSQTKEHVQKVRGRLFLQE